MTNVLVATSSRHGATAQIARAIGEVLTDNGLDVDVLRIEDVRDVTPYDAYVLGSAVYMGRWLPEARAFVEEHRELLATRPAWFFSSGPIGSQPAGAEVDTADVDALVHPRDHHVFGGRLALGELTRRERLFARLLRVQDGDYREWHTVTAWATAIARSLVPSPV
ncbi:MAG TPA: flavodoxin domain-containing protein [Gaiellaceae bacterium]|nr:flavodoxin domain-containing protein [Gaiellaceae bacterium]